MMSAASGASSTRTTTMKMEGEKPKSAPDAELFPLVEFPTPMGRETALVTRDEFRVEDNEGNVLARRVQASNFLLLHLLVSLVALLAYDYYCAVPGPSHPCVGPFHPQESGSDDTACQGRSRPRVRRARAMSRCLGLRRSRVCKSSASILRRCLCLCYL